MMTKRIPVPVEETLRRLLAQEDTDGDGCITIEDRGPRRFMLHDCDGRTYEIAGHERLANLLQDLTLAQRAGKQTTTLTFRRLFQPPADRLQRMILECYWDDLTRRTDEEGIRHLLPDEKTRAGAFYLYTPHNDPEATRYFEQLAEKHPEWNLEVMRLPARPTPEDVFRLNTSPGLLTLALRRTADGRCAGVPFIVPGGRFNEMYGWDSYFILLGLLQDGKPELARGLVDNLVYQIEHYGRILNANRSYYLLRSNPPFLTSMIMALLPHLPDDAATRTWLRRALTAAIKEYESVWMDQDHQTPTGLNRYFSRGRGFPPETEPGHYDWMVRPVARRLDMDPGTFVQLYNSGMLSEPEVDDWLTHDRAMRESGHDTTYRLIGRCAHLNTVDLNALLYKYETDIARLLQHAFGGSFTLKDGHRHTAAQWQERAQKRRERVNRYLWDESRGLYFDYDFVRQERTGYVSATTFYPLWAGLAGPEQAQRLVETGLPLLEAAGGLLSSTESSRGAISETRPQCQWDYPFGWAPHQMLVWQGLLSYGYDTEARRLAYRWLYTLLRNAVDYNGVLAEKYDVVRRTHRVNAEYGNVGTSFRGLPEGGFAWTNASFQVGLALLSPALRTALNRLIPPEWLW